MIGHRQCPICESDRVYYAFIKNAYPICACNDCGYLFMSPQPQDEELERWHKNSIQKSQSDLVKLERSTFFEKSKKLLDQYLTHTNDRALKMLANADVLEVGLREFHAEELHQSKVVKSYSAYCESVALCVLLKEKHKDVEIYGSFAEIKSCYDVCLLNEALEYVRDPVATLKKIHEMLRDNGILMIKLTYGQKTRNLISHILDKAKEDMLGYFGVQTIQNLLAKTGFEKIVASELGEGSLLVFATRKKAAAQRKLSILLPVYNESKTIKPLIDAVLALNLDPLEKEIIIIESNSTDDTRQQVLKYRDHQQVKILLEDKPSGKGRSVRNGLTQATGDFVIIQDGDLEYDLNDYEVLLQPLIKFQKAFVLGSRHSNGWKMRKFVTQPHMALMMNLGQIVFAFILNSFSGSSLKDPFTMYKVFRRDCVFNVDFTADRFDFDWELVIKLIRKGYYPLEIPVNYQSRSFEEGKKVRIIRDSISWLMGVWRFRFGKLYLKDYGA